MSTDAIIGCIAAAVSVGLVVYLSLWSRGAINDIARTGARAAREIVKGRNGE